MLKSVDDITSITPFHRRVEMHQQSLRKKNSDVFHCIESHMIRRYPNAGISRLLHAKKALALIRKGDSFLDV